MMFFTRDGAARLFVDLAVACIDAAIAYVPAHTQDAIIASYKAVYLKISTEEVIMHITISGRTSGRNLEERGMPLWA